MDDYDIKLLANEELREAIKVKHLNDELLEHLHSTLTWIIRYCAKNNMPIPNKGTLLNVLARTEEYIKQIPHSSPTSLKQPYKTTNNDTEPKKFIKSLNLRNFQVVTSFVDGSFLKLPLNLY